MSVFDLDTDGQSQIEEEAQRNPVPPQTVTPGFMTGIPSAISQGLMRGGARTAEMLGISATAPIVLYDKVLGTEHADRAFRFVDDTLHSAVDYWTPGPNEVGTAGRVLGGFAEMPIPLLLGAGNPEFLIANTELNTAKDLVSSGVSAPKAIGAGTIEGLATGLGFKIPFLGNTLVSRMASGAVGNLAVNTVASAINEQLLKGTGQEKQFDPWNLEARGVDVLSGMLFGGIAHIGARAPQSVRDATLTVENAKHFQQDTAPGIPADISSSVVHQGALEKAIRDVLLGEKVQAPQSVLDAQFFRQPVVAAQIPAELRAFDRVIPRAESLPAEQRAIESGLSEKISSNIDAAIAEYSKLPESMGGRILNTDIARELSPEYRADRTLSAAVHEPASYLVKELYARKLTEPTAEGESATVVFSAGGTGAGKTTGLSAVLQGELPQIIYDTNMNSLTSSVQKIEQALQAGKDVRVIYTYRHPVDALTNGSLHRAMRMGRTVPLEEHVKTHAGSGEVIKQLSEKYKENTRVKFDVFDNSGTRGQPRRMSLDELSKNRYTVGVEELRNALQQEYSQGRISETVYRGTRGPDLSGAGRSENIQEPGASGVSAGISDGQRTGAPTAPQGGTEAGVSATRPGSREASASRVDPVVDTAHRLIAESDLEIPTGELGADGSAKTLSARELLAQAKADVVQARHDAKGFEAAVTCFITQGVEV